MHLQGCVLRFAVVKVPGHFLHALVQAAAKRHIQFLVATADAEHRHAGGNRCLQQRQGQAIARQIVPGTGYARGAIVMMRFDI
ncbi:hypothetical protein D3C87_2032170 [compost metagenome]